MLPRHAEAVVERALSFPMSEVVQRYAKDQHLPLSIAEEHSIELKRYLALCALHPETSYGMRGPIDEFWHTFIVFTERYQAFCDQIAGRFLHHAPNVPEDERETGQEAAAEGAGSGSDTQPVGSQGSRIRDGYVRFLEDYQAAFGTAPPVHLWPRPMKHEHNPRADGCGCGTCYCGGGGCSCVIAVAFQDRQGSHVKKPNKKKPKRPKRPKTQPHG